MHSYFAKVYDAGTEANTESCDDIPAPPCNSHNARVLNGSEGRVSLHTGLKLTSGDLTPSDLFPSVAAKVIITRIQ